MATTYFNLNYTGDEINNLLENITPKSVTVVLSLSKNINNYQYSCNWADFPYQGYTVKILEYSSGGYIYDEDDIKDYLKVMTGKTLLPVYNQRKPQDSFVFSIADGCMWKYQYEEGTGLLAFKVTNFPFYTKAEIDDSFLKKSDASTTYLSKDAAEETYLTIDDAEENYLSKDDASDTYLTQEGAEETYATKGQSGTVTLYEDEWEEVEEGSYRYTLEIEDLGEYDAIFFTANSFGDQEVMDDIGIFINPNASGEEVTIEAVKVPETSIELSYFISNGGNL